MISKFWLSVFVLYILFILYILLDFFVSHSYFSSCYYLYYSHDLLSLFYHFHILCALTSQILLKLQCCDYIIIYDHLVLDNLCDLCDFYDKTVIKLWNSNFESLFWHKFWVHDITCLKDMLAWTQKLSLKQDLTFFRVKLINYFLTDSFAFLNR